MDDHRTVLRGVVKAALSGDTRIGSFDFKPAWHRSVNIKTAPVYTVHIPVDRSELSSQTTREWQTQIDVIVKRVSGNNIEDLTELDVEAIERAVIPALLALDDLITADTVGVDFEYSGEGASLVAQMTVRFQTVVCADIPTGA